MIQTLHLHKHYGELHVLNDVSLDIHAGEIVSIVGASGAGKTTLLQILGTLDRPDSGSIFFEGEEISSLGEKRLADFRNRRIGFIFQFHQLLPEFNALENVMLPGWIAGTRASELKQRAEELLDFLELKDRMKHNPNQLSGGEKQRVAVARALINNPKVILADEPSGSLDTVNKMELHNLFFRLRQEFGQTFVIVTHDDQLAQQTDRTIRMKDGIILKNNENED